MTTLCKAYSTEIAARRAVEALRATGVRARDIRLLTGSRLGDVRREPVGGFAGPVAPDAPVGTYGDRQVLRRQGTGGFAGDPDQQRQGSFADTDRVIIVTYDDDAERTRVTGLRGARRLLRRAGLDDDTVNRAAHALHMGHTVALVDLPVTSPPATPARNSTKSRAPPEHARREATRPVAEPPRPIARETLIRHASRAARTAVLPRECRPQGHHRRPRRRGAEHRM
jgi:hypothetical protein